jgi:ABC-type bacteriocin/lantibiotic exporter with double-glycine peptidase domain
MPVSLLMSKTLMRRMVNNNKRSAAMGAKMSGFNQEAFSNIQTIKAFDLTGAYTGKLKRLQKEYIDMRLEFQRMSMGTSFILSLVSMIVSYSAYAWGIYRVWSGAITYGSMTMFLGLSGTLTGSVHNLTSLIPSIISLTTSAGRLMDIVEMPREDYSSKDDVKKFWEENKSKGISLQVNEVAYAYKTGTQVFEGASLEVNPGEIVALVGPSGEGKTTMLRLILSLIAGQSCEAHLKGNSNNESVDLTPSTRFLFSYVPQGNTLLSGSIAQNLRMGKKNASEEELWEALRMADADTFVMKTEDGLDTKLTEKAGGLSEGQAQRIAIARALIRNKPQLILDEATSALDEDTESRILSRITKSYGKTIFIITHRRSMLRYCNRVIELSEDATATIRDLI